MSKLVFKIGEETRPTILTHKEFDASPFADQLRDAKKRMAELLEKWNNRRTSAKPAKRIPTTDSFEQPIDNNIIAFLGERGSGKTSCIYSIKEIFPKCKETESLANDTEFLHIIDPSFFDEHHNILEIFIGELYHEYEKIVRRWEQMPEEERLEVKKLHGLFAKVRQSIKFLSAQRLELPEDQEGLSALSEGVNLQLLVSKLVDAYLVCRKKKFLVVSIDDIDLNIREAYRMMEQIRKYLVIPNVVILMAAKLSQLKNSIVLKLAEYYKAIKDSGIEMHRIQTMADRYLDKFIPLERRIHMPVFADYSSAQLEIIDRGELVASPDNQYESVEFAVLSLIYKKCGYLFYNYENTPSLIIPETLRELRSFATMLFEMEDRDTPETHHKNKCSFKEYFHTQWLQRLPSDQQAIAETILKEKDLTKVNKTVVALLNGYARTLRSNDQSFGTAASESIDLSKKRLREIANPANYSENISIGDVMTMLFYLKNVAASSRINYLLFFVTTFYSMRLYELYDALTESIDNIVAGMEKSIGKKFPKLKSSQDYGLPDYYKMIGKGLFTLSGESLLPASPNRAYSRELSLMNGSLLFETIDLLIKEYEGDNEVLKDPKFILRLNIVEFFMLCASRKIESNDGSYSPFIENNWRAESSDFYFCSFDASSSKNILFDISVAFVNICYPSLAYRRFSKAICDIALECESSIVVRLYKVRRSENHNNVHDLLSRAAIRNTEVLQDVYLWMLGNKESYRDTNESELRMIWRFFDRFKVADDGYYVNTYELNKGKDDYLTIDFTPFQVVAEFLKTLETQNNTDKEYEAFREEQEKLFMRIYRRENMLTADTIYTLPELIRILRDSNENDIPEKDSIITSLMQNSQRMMSTLLVEYLAKKEVVDKALFSSYLDDSLYSRYVNHVKGNLVQYEKSLEQNRLSMSRRYKSFKEDLDSIDDQRKKIESQIASVRKRIQKEEAMAKSTELKIRDCSSEIKDISDMIKDYKFQLNKLTEEKKTIDSSLLECEVQMKSVNQDISQMEEEIKRHDVHPSSDPSWKRRLDNVKNKLNAIIETRGKLEMELQNISKATDDLIVSNNELVSKRNLKKSELKDFKQSNLDINNKLKQDRDVFENLHSEAKLLKQRHNDIQSRIESILDTASMISKEYDGFIKRKNFVLSYLNSGAR